MGGLFTFKVADLGRHQRWVNLEGDKEPERIRPDIRAAAVLLAEVAQGGHIYSGAEQIIAGFPPPLDDALGSALNDGFAGRDAATQLLAAVEDACLISGW